MKKLLFLTVLLFLTTNQSLAQESEPFLQWVKDFEFSESGYIGSIAVDVDENVYVVGQFDDTIHFDSIFDTQFFQIYPNYDGFVMKLDKQGNIIWVRQIRDYTESFYNTDQSCRHITVDSNGDLIIGGTFSSSFSVDGETLGSISVTNAAKNFFILKLDSDGNFLWSEGIGGANSVYIAEMALDNNDNIYITGSFNGVIDFNNGTSSGILTCLGVTGGPFMPITSDSYILKLDTDGEFVWVKQIGGLEGISTSCIAVDIDDNVYVGGNFTDTVYFDQGTGGAFISNSSSVDIFITKLNENGDFLWNKHIEGEGRERIASIALDSSGNIYSTGSFNNTVDFDPGAGVNSLTALDLGDIYVSKLDSNGEFLWAKCMYGPTSGNVGTDLVIDSGNNVYLTGVFRDSVDFDPGLATYFLNSEYNGSLFLQKLDSLGNLIWAKKTLGMSEAGELCIATDKTVYFSGTYYSELGFGEFNSNLIASYERAIFLMQIENGFVGLKDNIGDNSLIHIYPNPTSDLIYIESEVDVWVKVFDVNGSIVLEDKSKVVSLNTINNGLYFVVVYDVNNSVLRSTKVIKE